MDADDAAILASELPDKRALSSLFLSKNGLLTKEAGKALGDMLRDNTVLKVLDVSGSGYGMFRSDKDAPGFAQELAIGIKDNGAMTSLDLASNELGAEGAKSVAEAIKVTKGTPAIILEPFSCPSDFSINCCCLLLSAGYGGAIEVYFWW
jgi:hypothetical protein